MAKNTMAIFVAILIAAININVASAQVEVKETIFGSQLFVDGVKQENFTYVNKVAADSDSMPKLDRKIKVQTMVSVKYATSFGQGGYGAQGAAVEVSKVLKHFGYGGTIGTENSSRYGWANRAGLFVQAHTDPKQVVWGGLRLGSGYRQCHVFTDMIDANGNTYRHENSTLKPYGALEVVLNFNLYAEWVLSGSFGVSHSFVSGSDDKDQFQSGTWKLSDKKTDATRVVASLGLSKRIAYQTQMCGDKCWLGEVYSGQSNLGRFTGSKLYFFKRPYSWGGHILGFGAEGVKYKGNTLSRIYGLAALRYEPWGATNHVTLDGGVMGGIGDFPQLEVTSSTKEDHGATLTKTGNYFQFGAFARTYGEFSLFWGRFSVGVGGFLGIYSQNGNSYRGDLNYSGDEGKTSGFEKGWYGKVSFAF